MGRLSLYSYTVLYNDDAATWRLKRNISDMMIQLADTSITCQLSVIKSLISLITQLLHS